MHTKLNLVDLPAKRRNEILRLHAEDQKRAGRNLTIHIEEHGRGKYSAEFRRPDGSCARIA